MDDLAFGRLVRLARIERRWRQSDLAVRVGVSRSTVSRVERGHLGEISFDTVRAIAAAVDIRVQVQARARAVDIDRVMNARHSAMADYLASWIASFSGWIVRPEVSFSEYGERGVIDLLGWHASTRSLLVAEVKTELLEFGSLLGKLDAKDRLAPVAARRFDWNPIAVSTCLLVADSSTNRRRAAAHAALLRAALPGSGPTLARWLRHPSGTVRAMRFVPDARPGHVRNGFAGPSRIKTPAAGRRAA
jgi:transcriptional regulator with XRE-family HTH domain